ncbi:MULTISPECIES: phage tail assembly chaperone [Phytobacter]|uniref:phage tail assembly chaperone n=1 Tax=Phytobacter TaxID=447792 RepID=UPI0029112C0C|nr:hypothetical protein [Enterobacteriaceae bacterium]
MEFTINGVDYRAAKLSVFDQLKISRKLLPLIAKLVSDASMLKAATQDGAASREQLFASLEKILPKIADVLADMPDESVNAILHPCLSVVSRKTTASNWAPIFSGGELMFDDIDLFAMLGIAGRVVADNLGNFLHALPISETVAPQSA